MHSVQLLNAPCPHACRPPGLTALTLTLSSLPRPEAWQVAKLRSWSATSSAAAAARRLLALSPLLDPQWTNAHTQRRSEEDRQFVCQKRQSRALAHSFVRSLALAGCGSLSARRSSARWPPSLSLLSTPSVARSLALSSCLFLRSNFSESEFVTKVFVRKGGRRDGRTRTDGAVFARDICDLANTDGVSFGRNEGSRLT